MKVMKLLHTSCAVAALSRQMERGLKLGESASASNNQHDLEPLMTYRCWTPDSGDEEDGRDIDASDAQQAACEYVRWREAESCEYNVASGGETNVRVRTKTGVESFTVFGEAIPSYRAVKEKT